MLEDYRKFLSHIKKLNREEEALLWKQYKEEGILEARQSLIEHYQPLVFGEAMKHKVQEAVTLDLIQEGTVGLMEAAEKYNPETGVAFSLFAIHRIRGRIINFLQKEGNEVLIDYENTESSISQVITPDTPFESADRMVLNGAINRAMNRLPDKEKDVIRSVYLEEQTAQETASALEVSTAYVYRLEKRGIRRLRGMLSKLMHDRR